MPKKLKLEPPYYPIVYVRGYAMTADEREETFHDTYYGFAATSVEKRQAPPPDYFEADMFEGQLIRFMKMRDYGYADSVNRGIEVFPDNPTRSLWVCRFYDRDYFGEKIRSIEKHAEELRELVCKTIPERLEELGVNLGPKRAEFRVILIAHSMGGLVCRTLIQNVLPQSNEDPKRWIHRLVTMGTPHRGIDLGRIPDVAERFIADRINPFDSAIFSEDQMRGYLKLGKNFDVHSLGPENGPNVFPVKRCLCIIGSDYHSYGAVQRVVGNHSDGLVKQSRAYVVSGPKPKDGDYPDERTAFYANIHRAHSGRRGIVNSYESFENIQRFLFGNIKAQISFEDIKIKSPAISGVSDFYDFEFLFSIRNSSALLHRRQQDPCENAFRFERSEIPAQLLLHTAFMNSTLKENEKEPFSHFILRFRVLERRVKKQLLWDTEYPERQIYSESLEIRVGDSDPAAPGDELEYRWLSDAEKWKQAEPTDDAVYRIPLRDAGSIVGDLVFRAGPWPDNELTRDTD